MSPAQKLLAATNADLKGAVDKDGFQIYHNKRRRSRVTGNSKDRNSSSSPPQSEAEAEEARGQVPAEEQKEQPAEQHNHAPSEDKELERVFENPPEFFPKGMLDGRFFEVAAGANVHAAMPVRPFPRPARRARAVSADHRAL